MELCGEKMETKVRLHNCDECDSIVVTAVDLFDVRHLPHGTFYEVTEKYADLMDGEIASWDYDLDGILCIYYFL